MREARMSMLFRLQRLNSARDPMTGSCDGNLVNTQKGVEPNFVRGCQVLGH